MLPGLLPERIQLLSKLLQQQREILLVLGPLDVALETTLDRKFPIDVDAIE